MILNERCFCGAEFYADDSGAFAQFNGVPKSKAELAHATWLDRHQSMCSRIGFSKDVAPHIADLLAAQKVQV